ncbi:uncharacterized protein LOC135564915 [Oncorhynchus nerka]|uniref:uncharacterized protein LOC135564915 n=1 Tax=Oncorhynchus nerka TaxID=8023 RepID=UPI0031B81FED
MNISLKLLHSGRNIPHQWAFSPTRQHLSTASIGPSHRMTTPLHHHTRDVKTHLLMTSPSDNPTPQPTSYHPTPGPPGYPEDPPQILHPDSHPLFWPPYSPLTGHHHPTPPPRRPSRNTDTPKNNPSYRDRPPEYQPSGNGNRHGGRKPKSYPYARHPSTPPRPTDTPKHHTHRDGHHTPKPYIWGTRLKPFSRHSTSWTQPVDQVEPPTPTNTFTHTAPQDRNPYTRHYSYEYW